MNILEYTYSRLSSHSVSKEVEAQYNIGGPISSRYYVLGLHDNYLVESVNKSYIFRIYRNSWRTEEEIIFELELLAFLNNKTDQAAEVICTTEGDLAIQIDSPEGKRMAALFSYAEGNSPSRDISGNESMLLGSTLANIHNLTDQFTTDSKRSILDLPYLLDESLIHIEKFVTSSDISFLNELRNILYDALSIVDDSKCDYGICIGDVNPNNFHINDNQNITLFDFDQCGYGYRAFDIGKYFSSIGDVRNTGLIRNAFLDGYMQNSQLSHIELEAIRYYEVVSVIWVMAIHAVNADRIGYKYLEKPFWDRRLTRLGKLAEKYLSNKFESYQFSL